jgi:hypothetical protein
MLTKTAKLFLIALLAIGFTQTAQASKWANQFVEFELPNGWNCLLEGAEWVCQNQNIEKKREAIIILAAKIQGQVDTLDQYLNYLKNPKAYITPQGKSVSSQVKYAQNKTIQNHTWVDSLHMESEIPGFYTRYIATVKDGIGILVTYSVNRNKYSEYQSQFDALVESLKAFRREGGLNAAPAGSDIFKNAKVPSGLSSDSVFPVTGASDDVASSKPIQKKSGLAALMDDPLVFYGGIAVVALVLLSIVKRRKNS